jgi:hypothetical protein
LCHNQESRSTNFSNYFPKLTFWPIVAQFATQEKPMIKTETVRGRVNEVLKKRLEKFLKTQNARGKSLTESDVLIDALVEFLDRHEGNVAALIVPPSEPDKINRLNEPHAPYKSRK